MLCYKVLIKFEYNYSRSIVTNRLKRLYKIMEFDPGIALSRIFCVKKVKKKSVT